MGGGRPMGQWLCHSTRTAYRWQLAAGSWQLAAGTRDQGGRPLQHLV
jgi:hypothetical protein